LHHPQCQLTSQQVSLDLLQRTALLTDALAFALLFHSNSFPILTFDKGVYPCLLICLFTTNTDNMRMRFLIVLAAMFCSTLVFGQKRGLITNEVYPLYTMGGCDEPVLVTGFFHAIFDIQSSSAGVMKIRYHVNAKGRGYGEITGDKYEYAEITNETLVLGPNQVYTAHLRVRVSGQGRASDFYLSTDLHITINANGNLSAYFSDAEADCL
jgi:hypothetical protein